MEIDILSPCIIATENAVLIIICHKLNRNTSTGFEFSNSSSVPLECSCVTLRYLYSDARKPITLDRVRYLEKGGVVINYNCKNMKESSRSEA